MTHNKKHNKINQPSLSAHTTNTNIYTSILQKTYICTCHVWHLRIDSKVSQNVYTTTQKQIHVCMWLLRDKHAYIFIITKSLLRWNHNTHFTRLTITHSCQSIITMKNLSLLVIIIKDEASIFISLYYSFRPIRSKPLPYSLVNTYIKLMNSSINHNFHTLTLDLHLLIYLMP